MDSFFFFNDTATTEIYTLSLHDALPICFRWERHDENGKVLEAASRTFADYAEALADAMNHGYLSDVKDRKSTRLNSSHANISYAVFCLKKKKHTLHRPRCVNTDKSSFMS